MNEAEFEKVSEEEEVGNRYSLESKKKGKLNLCLSYLNLYLKRVLASPKENFI